MNQLRTLVSLMNLPFKNILKIERTQWRVLITLSIFLFFNAFSATAQVTWCPNTIYTNSLLSGISKAVVHGGRIFYVVGIDPQTIANYPDAGVLFHKMYLVDDTGAVISTLESTSIGDFGSVNLYEDTQGNLHIFYKTRPTTNTSYGFNGLYKVFNSAGTLVTNQTIFQMANFGISASLSKGSDGFVRLVHFAASGYYLLYEDNRTGSWPATASIPAIAGPSQQHWNLMTKVDNANQLEIVSSYSTGGATSLVNYTVNAAGTNATLRTVSTNFSTLFKLEYNASSNLEALYSTTTDLNLAAYQTGVWSTTSLSLNATGVTDADMIYDNNGNLIVSYNTASGLFVKKRTGGVWTTIYQKTITNASKASLLKISGVPYLVYKNGSSVHKLNLETGTNPTIAVSGSPSICTGSSKTLTTSGGTYLWSTGATTASINVTTAATYSVTVTQGDGCVKTATTTLTVDNSCRCSDSLQLVSLYNATAGGSWTNKWDLNQPMTTWYGVVLNIGGCVDSILLQSNKLNGTIPNLNLPNLQKLKLFSNQLTGMIPNFNLPNLKYIDLFSNQLTGTIPNFNLPNLEYLDLYSNQLSGTIPNFNLPNLQQLVIGPNQLSGTIPNFNLPNLQGLWLNTNQLSGTIPNFNLPNLQSLFLYNNQLSGTIPNFNLPNLKVLHLYGNQLNGCIPQGIKTNCPLIKATGGDISSNTGLITQVWANYWNNNEGACLTCSSVTATITGATNICGSSSTTLTATTNAVAPTYLWSTGATTPTINVSTSGSYNVTVTQSDGCVKSPATATMVTITPLPTPPSVGTITQPTCTTGAGTGSVVLSGLPTGTWTLTRNPNNVQTTGMGTATTVLDLPPGTYSFTVKNAAACVSSATANVVISTPTPPTALLSANAPTCGQSNGSITSTVTGGTPPYSYLWSNGATTANITNISTASTTTYTFSATDANQCSAFSSVQVACTAATCRELDSLQLVALYNATNGANWTNKTNWLTLNPIETWYGVTVNASGCVTSITLQNNLLSGTVPNLNISNLQTLWLYQNQLTGTLPPFTLPNLLSLSLHTNQFTGSIPNFDMPKLTYLSLAFNQLSGTIPNFTMPNLLSFHLNNNQLTGAIPNVNMPVLQTLWVYNNQLSGVLPAIRTTIALQCQSNKFTFQALLPNLPPISNKIYTPQDSIFTETTYTKTVGDPLSINLGIDASVASNVYKWYKNGSLHSTLTGNNTLTFNSLQATDAGTYTCQVTNPAAPLLTLYSRKATVVVNAVLVDTTTCRYKDSLQLVALYNATNGANWLNKTNWLTANPINTWYGITLNTEGCVTCIDLDGDNSCSSARTSGNNLVGTIPNLNLPNLEGLYLLFNKLSGNIPNFTLPNLKYLDLSVNQLSGSIPNFNLPNLLTLNLGTNQLTGSIPNFNLPNLQKLWLAPNQLSGSIPNFNLPNLQTLYLYYNQLSGCIPQGIKTNCPLITATGGDVSLNPSLNTQSWANYWNNNEGACSLVDTTSCRYKDSLQLVALYNATNGANWTNKWILTQPITTWYNVAFNAQGCVEELNLYENNLTGTSGIPNLSLSGLKHLRLQNNSIGGAIPTFTGLPLLETLNLGGNRFSIMANQTALPNLTYLNVNTNQIAGPLPDLRLPKLQELFLGSNKFSGTLTNYTNLPVLTKYHVQANNLTGIVPMITIPSLAQLQIEDNDFDSLTRQSMITVPISQFWMKSNRFTFDDIVPNANLLFTQGTAFAYTPQDSIFVDTTITVTVGGPLSINLKIDGALTDNVYTWQRDGNPVTSNGSQNLNRFIKNTAVLTDAGVYTCRVTNPRASALTLVSRKIKVVVLTDYSCLGRDSVNLAAFNLATNPNGWRTKWNLAHPLDTTWYGIYCTNTEGCISSLDLDGSIAIACAGDASSGNNLTAAAYPPALFELSGLELLYLSGNKIGTYLPPNIGRLTRLRELQLMNSGLSSLSDSVWTLSNLEGLVLNGNPLNQTLPSKVGGLTKIQRLHFNNCGLKGAMPQALTTLNALRYVDIENNDIDSFPNLSALPVLSQNANFNLKNNRLTFDDIVPNKRFFRAADTVYTYTPQQKFFVDTTINVTAGSTLNLDLKIDGAIANSNYKWFKDNLYLRDTNRNKLIMRGIQANQAGVYRCEVTNLDAPALTLYSRNITVVVQNQPCTATIGTGANRRLNIDSIPCNGGTSPFVNFAFATGAQIRTYKIDTFTQVLDPVFRNKIKAGQHTASIIDEAGCRDTLIFTIGQPTPLVLNSPTLVNPKCATDRTGSIAFANIMGGTTPYTFAWSNGATSRDILNLLSGSYTLILTDNKGCKDSLKTTIAGNLVASTTTLNPSICAGQSYTLPNGSVVMPTANTIYRDTVRTSGGCDSLIRVVNLTVSPLATPSVSTPIQPTCSVATGSVTLNGLPSTGTWTINPGAITGTGITKIITGLTAGTYNFTVTNTAGCVSSATANVVINAAPTPPTTPSVSTPIQPTCSVATGSVTLNGLPSTGTWTINPGAITGTGISKTITGLTAGMYNFTVTNAAGCVSSATANVVISPAPTPPTTPSVSTPIQPTCSVSTGSVTLNGLPSGTWTINPGAITGTGISKTITGLTAGMYNFTVTNAAGCVSSASANVVISPAPTPPTTPSVSTPIQPTCSVPTGSVTLNGLPSTGTWTINPGAITGTGITKIITGLTAGTYNFTVTNTAGCVSSATANVVINAGISATTPIVGTITQMGCTIETSIVPLSGLPPTGAWTLTRSPGNVTVTGTGASTNVTGLPAGTYTYTVTNSANCVSPASTSIVINPKPSIPDAPSVGKITPSICDTATGTVLLNGLPATGTWKINPTGVTGTGVTTTIKDLKAGSYSFAVANAAGCASSSVVAVVTCVDSQTEPCLGDLLGEIPNGFTPGGNGTNDIFNPQKYLSLAGCSKNVEAAELHVMNRWGETIYKAIPYAEWNGKSITQQQTVPTGVYYYVLVVNVGGSRKSIKGVLHVFVD